MHWVSNLYVWYCIFSSYKRLGVYNLMCVFAGAFGIPNIDINEKIESIFTQVDNRPDCFQGTRSVQMILCRED